MSEPLPYVLVANVTEATAAFAAGARVVLAPFLWGDGGEALTAIGYQRGSHGKRLATAVVARRKLENLRIKREGQPALLERLRALYPAGAPPGERDLRAALEAWAPSPVAGP